MHQSAVHEVDSLRRDLRIRRMTAIPQHEAGPVLAVIAKLFPAIHFLKAVGRDVVMLHAHDGVFIIAHGK